MFIALMSNQSRDQEMWATNKPHTTGVSTVVTYDLVSYAKEKETDDLCSIHLNDTNRMHYHVAQ